MAKSQANKKTDESPNRLVQSNVRYPASMLEDAQEAADWEGISRSDYHRSALKARLYETQAKRLRLDRIARGEIKA